MSTINFTDTELLSGVSQISRPQPLNEQDQQSPLEREQFNQPEEVIERFQPLNRFGGELIERYNEIDRLQLAVESRQEGRGLLTELQGLLEDPTESNLAAAEDVLRELEDIRFINETGELQQVVDPDDVNRLQFDIPGQTLERLSNIISENDLETEVLQRELNSERDDLQRFIENQGVQVGETFTSQGEVISSFLNVAETGQLLDTLL